MRIAFCGAEGTGKTTLVDKINLYPKIINLTRTVPKHLRGTAVGQGLILKAYAEEFAKRPSYVSDRSVFDICTYSVIYSVWDSDEVTDVLNRWSNTIGFPDILFYLPPEFPLVDDGQRPTNLNREEYSEIMTSLLKVWKPHYVTLRGSVEERLKEANAHVLKYQATTRATYGILSNTNPGSSGPG